MAACKKDKVKDPSLAGKWTLVNTELKVYVNGTMVFSANDPGNGATVDFQSNGTVVLKESGGGTISSPYTIKNSSTVEIDGESYEIKGLTNSNVTLHRREDTGGGSYDDETINLKR